MQMIKSIFLLQSWPHLVLLITFLSPQVKIFLIRGFCLLYRFMIWGYNKWDYIDRECYSLDLNCAADVRRNTLASVFPESPVSLFGYVRPGPFLSGCFRVPRHGCALRSHRGHRGLHRLETIMYGVFIYVCMMRVSSSVFCHHGKVEVLSWILWQVLILHNSVTSIQEPSDEKRRLDSTMSVFQPKCAMGLPPST